MRTITVVVFLLLLGSCAADRPSIDTWVAEQWGPITRIVPEPSDATQDSCDEALAGLRERASGLDPTPSDEIREAAHGWLTAAESLMFDCASDSGLDYVARHERLLLRQAEVETLLEGS